MEGRKRSSPPSAKVTRQIVLVFPVTRYPSSAVRFMFLYLAWSRCCCWNQIRQPQQKPKGTLKYYTNNKIRKGHWVTAWSREEPKHWQNLHCIYICITRILDTSYDCRKTARSGWRASPSHKPMKQKLPSWLGNWRFPCHSGWDNATNSIYPRRGSWKRAGS